MTDLYIQHLEQRNRQLREALKSVLAAARDEAALMEDRMGIDFKYVAAGQVVARIEAEIESLIGGLE